MIGLDPSYTFCVLSQFSSVLFVLVLLVVWLDFNLKKCSRRQNVFNKLEFEINSLVGSRGENECAARY